MTASILVSYRSIDVAHYGDIGGQVDGERSFKRASGICEPSSSSVEIDLYVAAGTVGSEQQRIRLSYSNQFITIGGEEGTTNTFNFETGRYRNNARLYRGGSKAEVSNVAGTAERAHDRNTFGTAAQGTTAIRLHRHRPLKWPGG